jgi:hypothetical protein
MALLGHQSQAFRKNYMMRSAAKAELFVFKDVSEIPAEVLAFLFR